MYLRVALSALLAAASATVPPVAHASDNDQEFFRSISGQWTGPGEIVAGKYKGTKFVCNFTGAQPGSKIGVDLDGTCNVGVFSQKMQARIERRGKGYQGSFLDGAEGKGLDVVSGNVDGDRVVLAIARNSLRGAMLARMNGSDNMNVTVSVKVDSKMVQVLGMSLKRVDGVSTGSVAKN